MPHPIPPEPNPYFPPPPAVGYSPAPESLLPVGIRESGVRRATSSDQNDSRPVRDIQTTSSESIIRTSGSKHSGR
jgi:hypothetical protein